MVRTLIYTLFISIILSAASLPAMAQNNIDVPKFSEPRDSAYYLKDGEFTDAEKDEEALYIFQKCNNNTIQKQLYDCSCVSGSFRNARDSEKLIPQSLILSTIYNEKDSTCANVTGVAGKTYENCMNNAKYYDESKTVEESSKYCSCLANKSARDFSKSPKLDLRYFGRIKTQAAKICRAAYKRKRL